MSAVAGPLLVTDSGPLGQAVLLTRRTRTKGWPTARAEQTGIATKAVAALG